MNFIMKLNPIPMVMEAFTESFGEEFGDDFKVPNLREFAQRGAEALSKIFWKEIDVLLDLFERLWSRIKDVARDPAKLLENLKGAFQDIAHALFNSVENIVKGVWQFVTEIFELVVTFIEGIWKIPLITDFFECSRARYVSHTLTSQLIVHSRMVLTCFRSFPFSMQSRMLPFEFSA